MLARTSRLLRVIGATTCYPLAALCADDGAYLRRRE
jgi:hypothetical protein